MGFNLAFGITAYDGTSEFIEDPEIGTMKAYYRAWGVKDTQNTYGEEPIDTRLCKPEDFPQHQIDPETGEIIQKTELEGEEKDREAAPFFFPRSTQTGRYFDTYTPKMHCFKDNRLRISG